MQGECILPGECILLRCTVSVFVRCGHQRLATSRDPPGQVPVTPASAAALHQPVRSAGGRTGRSPESSFRHHNSAASLLTDTSARDDLQSPPRPSLHPHDPHRDRRLTCSPGALRYRTSDLGPGPSSGVLSPRAVDVPLWLGLGRQPQRASVSERRARRHGTARHGGTTRRD